MAAVFAPLTNSYAQSMLADPASVLSLSDEAMEEVNLSPFYPRYTVYRIADVAKRCLLNDVIPVIQRETGGVGGVWNVVTQVEIWFPAGYVRFTTPNGSSDALRAHSGHYLVPELIFGCATKTFETSTVAGEITCEGDTGVMRYPKQDDWKATLAVFHAKLKAGLEVAGGNPNSTIVLRHEPGGVAGNAITFAMVAPSDEALSVGVVGDDITVYLAKSTTITSTAKSVIKALNNSVAVKALGIVAGQKGTETGAGIVDTKTQTSLTGGLDEIDYTSFKGKIMIWRFYPNKLTNDMYVGYGLLKSIDWQGSPTDFIKANISVDGSNYPLYRTLG